MKTVVILLMVISIYPRPAAAQPSDTARHLLDAREQLTDGWHRLDRAQLAEAGAAFARATSDRAYAAFAHYYAGLALYHQVGLIPDDREAQLRLLNEAIKHLEEAGAIRRNFADAVALLATAYGRKIMLQPASAFVLGPRLDRLMKRAQKAEPDNPRVILLAAISAYNRPKLWGGSRERGLEGMQKAAALFGRETYQNSELLMPDWGHEEAYAWIGLAHLDAGRLSEAEAALHRAMDLAPAYGWVQHVLLPRLAAAQVAGRS